MAGQQLGPRHPWPGSEMAAESAPANVNLIENSILKNNEGGRSEHETCDTNSTAGPSPYTCPLDPPQLEPYAASADCRAIGQSGSLYGNRGALPLPTTYQQSYQPAAFVPIYTTMNLVAGEAAEQIEYALILNQGELGNANVYFCDGTLASRVAGGQYNVSKKTVVIVPAMLCESVAEHEWLGFGNTSAGTNGRMSASWPTGGWVGGQEGQISMPAVDFATLAPTQQASLEQSYDPDKWAEKVGDSPVGTMDPLYPYPGLYRSICYI